MKKRRLMASDDLFLLPLAFQWRCFSFYHLWFQSSVLPSERVDANGWCPRAGAFSVWNSGFRPKRWEGGERTHVSVTRSGVSQGGRRLRGSHRLTEWRLCRGAFGNLCLLISLLLGISGAHRVPEPTLGGSMVPWSRGDRQGPGRQSPRAQSQHTLTHMRDSWRVPASQRLSVTALDLAMWVSVLETSPQDCSSPFYCPAALFKHGKRTVQACSSSCCCWSITDLHGMLVSAVRPRKLAIHTHICPLS